MSTLIYYGSEPWTVYPWLENKFNTFYLRCLRTLRIKWQDKATNVVLRRAGCPNFRIVLSNRRLSWLGHVHRMPQGRLSQDILYGELTDGWRPVLRCTDVLENNIMDLNIDENDWETMSRARAMEDYAVSDRRAENPNPPGIFTCSKCGRTCASKIGLFSHKRSCMRKDRLRVVKGCRVPSRRLCTLRLCCHHL